MSFFIGLLTAILFIDCVFLILLILVQLPKKEAGMGTAFGGAATDALFGAGTGNALTKLTKYATAIFFCLALALSVLNANRSYEKRNRLQDALKQQTAATANPAQPPTLSTNLLESMAKTTSSNLVSSSNQPVAAATITNAVKSAATSAPVTAPVASATNQPSAPAN